jgi:hypothetical protein
MRGNGSAALMQALPTMFTSRRRDGDGIVFMFGLLEEGGG